MPHAESNGTESKPEPKKLILCFDGTGNTFSGTNADTNVVKLLSKLDRNHADQYHYYQTGIGTYDINATSVNQGILSSIRSSISKTLDQGFGTTFDAHVMAGYRFLMRYYETGAKIYIFGFSRGAYTAKFLARMVNKVGLLCKGNEEMVPFAFVLYQRYLQGEFKEEVFSTSTTTQANGDCPIAAKANGSSSQNGNADGHANGQSTAEDQQPLHSTGETPVTDNAPQTEVEAALCEIKAFSHTFCRKEPAEACSGAREENIKVYFLGMWDCVNSVAVLEAKAKHPVPVTGTAHYVRHAVAIDERRVKFKPALLAQDVKSAEHNHESVKEVWFPGNHGDVGGGWPAVRGNNLDGNNTKDMSWWDRFKNIWVTRRPEQAGKNVMAEPLQMSDIPLAWMINELELVAAKDARFGVKWCTPSIKRFKEEFKNRHQEALTGFMHDTLSYGYGTAFLKVTFWKFMEWFPLIKRYELNGNGKWEEKWFPLNKGSYRDIPIQAELHESVLSRLHKSKETYKPENNNGGDSSVCLKKDAFIEKKPDEEIKPVPKELEQAVGEQAAYHKIYKFKGAPADEVRVY